MQMFAGFLYPTPGNSRKFCVNGDWENPMTLDQAIMQAKVECFDDMCANRPAVTAICGMETGEVLMFVGLCHDMTFKVSRAAYVYDMHGNFLRSEYSLGEAVSWISENGYKILCKNDHTFTVCNSSVWFTK